MILVERDFCVPQPGTPLTLEQCLKVKQDAFRYLGELALIAGTEDCTEEMIDQLVSAEGLYSPVYFQVENAGRRHAELLDAASAENLKRKMLNPLCLVPLWHLVYHDSLMTFPYWGILQLQVLPCKRKEFCLPACTAVHPCIPSKHGTWTNWMRTL